MIVTVLSYFYDTTNKTSIHLSIYIYIKSGKVYKMYYSMLHKWKSHIVFDL